MRALRIPGDKSISHRCLMVAALCSGESRFSSVNTGADVRATAQALTLCGIPCGWEGDRVVVTGGALRDPPGDLDFGNSGTGVRLMAGLLAGAGVRARLTGDASLRLRPMDRIVEPLRAMGADVRAREDRLLPLEIAPAALRPLRYRLPVPSAQVKSCLLLAGLAARVPVWLEEPAATRDHTERMLASVGAAIRYAPGLAVLEPSARLEPLALRVPADFSSAAFFLALAALVPGLALELGGVGVNAARTGLLEVLRDMGADVQIEARGQEGGEPLADLSARHAGRLRAVAVGPELAPRLIDEVPVLAVLAANARGTTRLEGLGELRVKESDRLRSLALGLGAVGVPVRELEGGLEITGIPGPFRGTVDTHRDHRIAMAFAVLAKLPGSAVRLTEEDSIATSFPEFPVLLTEALA